MDKAEEYLQEMEEYFINPRFKEITRLYTARQVVEQQGTIHSDYSIAKNTAKQFYDLLRELIAKGESITTFGPYSPGQATTMKRMGIKGIYIGGWATSAKGSITEDPGSDLASYPLSQVPDEAATVVRALLAADKNQQFERSRMTEEQLKKTPVVDYRPFIIADADTGHGGDAHVRNLIRRFVEVGVPGYHIEDQRPGAKKCGHQGGKVLVSVDEQIKRLNTARFQLDIMKVPGIIVARTDAESATLLETNSDERDHPFILGVTNTSVVPYRISFLALLKSFYDGGVKEINGHLLYNQSDSGIDQANQWFKNTGLDKVINNKVKAIKKGANLEKSFNDVHSQFADAWEAEAGLKTIGEAVADLMKFHKDEGIDIDVTDAEWLEFAKSNSIDSVRAKALEIGIDLSWSCELARTPEGYYQIRGGIEFATARSLTVAPYADIIWMETKTANLDEARIFADAMHEIYPGKMLAYNLSPSFSWDTTGMNEQEMIDFPAEIGKLGFVFNFITYGGHQIDGLASEDFSRDLIENGMLALAKLQRKFRLVESPYKTPQTLVGGNRLDAALTASSGRTATTKAMGKGSTQFQHLVQTEVPPSVLEKWLEIWSGHYRIVNTFHVKLRPHRSGSELLDLSVSDEYKNILANVVFATIQDRTGKTFLSIRDQNMHKNDFRRKRFMTLLQLFLIFRYKVTSIHYVTPTEDNHAQTNGMKKLGIFNKVHTEIGDIIVADVNDEQVQILAGKDPAAITNLITKKK